MYGKALCRNGGVPMPDEKLLEAFHLMWDFYPEAVMLIDKSRTILALNPAAEAEGRQLGSCCSLIEPLEKHKGCRAQQAWQTGAASVRKKPGKLGDIISFWLPISGYPDYLVHFSVGASQKYDYNV